MCRSLLLLLILLIAQHVILCNANDNRTDAENDCFGLYRPFGKGFDSQKDTQKSFQGMFRFIIVCIASWPIAVQFPKYLHLPMLNGWLLTGLIAGPYILDVVTDDMMKVWGSHISMLAFSFIGLEAGYMLYGPDIKPAIWDILKQVIPVSFISLVGVGFIIGLLGDLLGGFFADYDDFVTLSPCLFLTGLLFGALMASGSPAECVALIHELQPHGPMVILTVGFTILMDVVAIVIASILVNAVKASCTGEFSTWSIPLLLVDISSAFFVGWPLGKFFACVSRSKLPSIIQGAIILPTALAIFELGEWIHLITECYHYGVRIESLLLVLVASSVAGNNELARTKYGHILHSCALPIFLMFFVYVGAHLDLGAVESGIGIAGVLIGLRIVCMNVGSTLAGKYLNHHSPEIYQWLWLTYLPQAGVTLAIAAEVEHVFKSSWGSDFNAVAVTVVLFFEVLGPIALKFGLFKSGSLDGYVGEIVSMDVSSNRSFSNFLKYSTSGQGTQPFNQGKRNFDTVFATHGNTEAHQTFDNLVVRSKREISITQNSFSQYRKRNISDYHQYRQSRPQSQHSSFAGNDIYVEANLK